MRAVAESAGAGIGAFRSVYSHEIAAVLNSALAAGQAAAGQAAAAVEMQVLGSQGVAAVASSSVSSTAPTAMSEVLGNTYSALMTP